MHSLIIQKNMTKRATEEDGPSFEQQFGILANAVISDKFPQLDSMKLAFQLIDKSDDNTKACGASVYIVGRTVIFVPAFFKNGQLKTGDMMLIGETQQFLPMSDPWLAWIKSKDLVPAGEQVPTSDVDPTTSAKSTTIREIADPIIKTASVYLKGLCRLDPDLTKTAASMNVFDTALHMGKQATESMLDNMMKEDLLNATLSFYSPEDLQKFATDAQAMDPAPAFKVIMPFDKEAKDLSTKEQHALYKDGFFIKCAAEGKEVPTVIRKKKVNDLFGILKEGGKTGLLQPDGTIKEVYVFEDQGDLCGVCPDGNYDRGVNSYTANRDGFFPPHRFDKQDEFIVIADNKPIRVRQGVMELLSDREAMNDDMFDLIGQKLSSVDGEFNEGYVLTQDGMAFRCWNLRKVNANTWKQGDIVFELAGDDSKLKKPMMTAEDMYLLPANSRFISSSRKSENDRKEKVPAISFVTMANLDSFITNYTDKHYKKARIYANGSDYTVSGDNSDDGDKPLSFKEACLALVSDYGVAPADAKVMVKDASNGATYDNPKATSYLITKTATETGGWQDANIPMDQIVNPPPQIEQRQLPSFIEDPAQLEKAVTTAAQNGIKEVFDVTVLKLLVKQNHFFDEIHDDLPLFMQVLDSLCRKLFQFYWHTEKMEEKYGMVKLKSLEESLKVTLDSLSELTIFFKLRTVDGTGSTGDTLGDLMSGQML